MQIIKVFNNSVILASDRTGREIVIRGKGVGFKKTPGDDVDPTRIEKAYFPTGEAPVERLAQLLLEIPANILGVVEKIISRARERLDPSINENIFFPLADHLNFAIQRSRQGASFDYPLKWEISSLYPREVRFAREVLDFVEAELSVTLPASEAMPLALHFVNGQLSSPEMTTAMRVTDALSESIKILTKAAGHHINPEENSTSRFITHLRYLIARRIEGKTIPEMNETVATALRNSGAKEYDVARQIIEMIETRLEIEIGRGELMYLTVHVLRVFSSLGTT